MSLSRLWAIPMALVAAAVVAFAPAAARDRKPPRIVAAAMVDANADFRADRVRLTYSEPVHHAVDRDGHYPIAVTGYRIRSLGAGRRRTLLVYLVEKRMPDGKAKPAIRYTRTRSKPVGDRAGNQAIAQLFRRVRPHGHRPPSGTVAPSSPAQPPTPAGPGQPDADHDGTVDAKDCAPRDPAIHPGAPDLPDLSFVDSNCDGIDGTEADAIFVSPQGNDANPGTKAKPKQTIQAAVATVAAGNGKYVLVAAYEYAEVDLGKKNSGVGIYGGYSAKTWARGTGSGSLTAIDGSPQAVLADGATGVVLQLVFLDGSPLKSFGASGYGIRALNGSKLLLEGVTVATADAYKGADGASGVAGANGEAGGSGDPGNCDDGDIRPLGGHGGFSPVADRRGGKGGEGGHTNPVGGHGTGDNGSAGGIGTPGGEGAQYGDPGYPGGNGRAGSNGAAGAAGAGGSASTVFAGAVWVGQPGTIGRPGQAGNGGGGGGGGGQQDRFPYIADGAGNGGGGGGGGAAGGAPGTGGGPGGGSFGLYLYNSSVEVESSKIGAGDGGLGGDGGHGGAGGTGGAGGSGGAICTSEVGRGGDGGSGGNGGLGGYGGGGAGGPSIGIFKIGKSSAKLGDTKVDHGRPGAGGDGNSPVPGSNGATGLAADVYPS